MKYVDAIQNYFDIIQKHEAQAEIERAKQAKIELAKAEEKARLRELNRGKVGLTIISKKRKWAGYINLATKKKYQIFVTGELEIDANKDWLLLLGGGSITLDVNHVLETYSSKSNMRFKYVDGKLTKIGVEEFKKLNNGNKW